MTGLASGRFILYLVAMASGGLALAGLADFDAATWTLDIRPFNVRDFVLTGGATAGNIMAAIAVWRKWGRK